MSLALLDWRRRVARLYAEVRGEPDVAAAHEHWRRARDELLRTHPVSPIPGPQRAGYPGAPVAAYDPAWACPLAPPGNTLARPLLAGELMPPPEGRS